MTIKSCLKSMRLRTLPLSLAGVITGMALASSIAELKMSVVISLIFTTIFLQILSNLSNELGDTLNGTDTAARQGIHYSIQDGEMTVAQMKKLIAVIAILCCISGILMVKLSFKTLFAIQPIFLLLLGAFAIWAAMHYTLGNNPYGYRGLGDIFVFIFFGIVSVIGSGFVCSHIIMLNWLLPASAIGLWSIGVLNVNNIRDMDTDVATRTTVALKLGLKRARIYQTILVSAGWSFIIIFTATMTNGWQKWIYLVTIPLFCLHLRGVWSRVGRELDPMLPMLVISTFATAILFALGI